VGLSLGVSPREPLERVASRAAAAEEHGFEALWYIDLLDTAADFLTDYERRTLQAARKLDAASSSVPGGRCRASAGESQVCLLALTCCSPRRSQCRRSRSGSGHG
jgi:hypothetical protein